MIAALPGMKMDLVVMSRPSHTPLWNRSHFLGSQLGWFLESHRLRKARHHQ